MTFKDLIRLLRRRWLVAAVVALLVVAGYVTATLTTEEMRFLSRTRIQIQPPPIFITATQGSQFITIEQTDSATWLALMRGPAIRREARKLLTQEYEAQGKTPPGPAAFADIQIVPESGTQLVWIEAVASSPDEAAAVANAMVAASIAYSGDKASDQVRKAKEDLDRKRDESLGESAKRKAAADALRDDVRSRFGVQDLESAVKDLRETYQEHDRRKRELDRRVASVGLKLERIKKDRSVVEHLQRQSVPRLGSASLQSRVEENAEVQRLREQLEREHRELQAMRRRYTEAHPKVKGALSDIQNTELRLTRAQARALGRDIDREEISLHTEQELAAIERKVLDPELRRIKTLLDRLSPLRDREASLDAAHQTARDRAERMLEHQERLTEPSGYITLADERAAPANAIPMELRLRKSWPVALLAALVCAIGFAFLMEFLDTSIRNDYDVRRHLDYPVLAVVPRVQPEQVLSLTQDRASTMAEIFDTLATVMLSLPSESASRVFVVTSSNPQEGKTAVSTNLAVALARQGKRTLLVDGDMRVPTVHTHFGLSNDTGLSDLLLVQMGLTSEGLLRETELVPNLSILTSGMAPENPYELLDASRVGPAATQFRENFDAVVIDTPPVLRTGDPLKFSTAADAVLFIVQAGRTEQRQATWAKRLLTSVNARVAGVLLNRAVNESEEYYYYYDRPYDGRTAKSHRRV